MSPETDPMPRLELSEIEAAERPFAQLSIDELEERVRGVRGTLAAIEAELAMRRGRRARALRWVLNPTVREDHSVYVIELRKDIWQRSDFAERNAGEQVRRDYPCLYIGMTSKTPQDRLREHLAGGELSSRKVAEYGVVLRPEFYERLNPMTREEAAMEERSLAETLGRAGYPVWWN